MFKIFSEKNNKLSDGSLAVANAERAERLSNGTQQTSSSNSATSTATKNSTLSAMKRGKKKLSSIVNKLQKSGKRFSIRKNKNKRSSKLDDGDSAKQLNGNHLGSSKVNGLPYDFDSDVDKNDDGDDDDDAYKSAEEEIEQCQVNSRHMDKQASEPKTQESSSKKYQSIDSEKLVLPEEQCDIPTFLHTKNCDRELIDETRRLLRERYVKNPDSFYDDDYNRMLKDDWTVTRFLLRRRLDPKRTAKLMEECGRFRRQYKMSEVQLWEFPIEFHKAGGLFMYAPDRVGNTTMYMRVKMYRRVPEISDVFKAWILCLLEKCDVANNGRGTAVIFDLSGCGLQNVDLGFLSWLLSSFRNYCPKGVSYILVYNLPWILSATCKMAMTWMSASNRRALRFVHGNEIENFIARENLPDYCGGTCKLNYKMVPKGSKPAIEVCDRLDMTPAQAIKIRELFKEYLDDDYDRISEKTTAQKHLDSRSHYDDAKSTILDNNNELHANETLANGNISGQTNSNNTNRISDTRTQSPLPVVDLVTQASRFIAQ